MVREGGAEGGGVRCLLCRGGLEVSRPLFFALDMGVRRVPRAQLTGRVCVTLWGRRQTDDHAINPEQV